MKTLFKKLYELFEKCFDKIFNIRIDIYIYIYVHMIQNYSTFNVNMNLIKINKKSFKYQGILVLYVNCLDVLYFVCIILYKT